MTDKEKKSLLKVMVGNETDEILSAYLMLAGKKILSRAYPYDDTITNVPYQYEALQLEIAAYLINKRGAEGQTAHSENGISRTYENADVPSSMLKSITPHCGVIK